MKRIRKYLTFVLVQLIGVSIIFYSTMLILHYINIQPGFDTFFAALQIFDIVIPIYIFIWLVIILIKKNQIPDKEFTFFKIVLMAIILFIFLLIRLN
jgi:hypothetical protein